MHPSLAALTAEADSNLQSLSDGRQTNASDGRGLLDATAPRYHKATFCLNCMRIHVNARTVRRMCDALPVEFCALDSRTQKMIWTTGYPSRSMATALDSLARTCHGIRCLWIRLEVTLKTTLRLKLSKRCCLTTRLKASSSQQPPSFVSFSTCSCRREHESQRK